MYIRSESPRACIEPPILAPSSALTENGDAASACLASTELTRFESSVTQAANYPSPGAVGLGDVSALHPDVSAGSDAVGGCRGVDGL